LDRDESYSIVRATWQKVPWKDIFWGMFVPLNIIHFLVVWGRPFEALCAGVLACILYNMVEYLRRKTCSLFALMVAAIILLNFGTSPLQKHEVLYLFVVGFDNSVVGIIFLLSLLTSKPVILLFLEEDVLNKIPDAVKATPYYMKAWRILTAIWGLTYVLSAIIVVLLKLVHARASSIVDYCFGWPMVVILFIFSVNFPHYYWEKRMANPAPEPAAPDK
jgi:hypothetical protein